jgi:5-methylcytosine-specific restriction endonuclease McrA
LVHVGPRSYCEVPPSHPARRAVNAKRRVFCSGPCAWCGEVFTIVDQISSRYCGKRCAKAAGKARRGRFVISANVRAAIYQRDGWVCQLCNEPVDPLLPISHAWAATLDHIVCRSWTDAPDDSPSNLRLAHRWCNSVRSDERYYTVDVLQLRAQVA